MNQMPNFRKIYKTVWSLILGLEHKKRKMDGRAVGRILHTSCMPPSFEWHRATRDIVVWLAGRTWKADSRWYVQLSV